MRVVVQSNGAVVVQGLEAMIRRIDPAVLLEDFGEHMINISIPANFKAGGRPAKWASSAWTRSGKALMRDRGNLEGSIQPRVSGGTLKLGSSSKYAAQRQFGGKLVPKKAKALAIPLPGVPASMARPSRWGDRLFFLKAEKGKRETIGVLAAKVGRGEKKTPKAMFVLRKSAMQPARPFLLFQGDDIAWVHRRLLEAAANG
ncbi:MAG TPA: hypothetical protein PLA94_24995 [Myxococcota bacterium]|nr:hypothetical protein [Myxococcota bacterium]